MLGHPAALYETTNNLALKRRFWSKRILRDFGS